MSKIKMVISDMDGTLLNSQKMISQKNLAIINQLPEKGIIFSIATGRTYSELTKYLQQIKSTIPVVALNGGIIYDEKGNIVEEHPFSQTEIAQLIKILTDKNVYFQLVGDTYFYSNAESQCQELIRMIYSKDMSVDEIKQNHTYLKTKFVDCSQLITEQKIYKALVFGLGNTNLLPIAEDLSARHTYEISSSGPDNIEINPLGVSKGKGIQSLQRYYQIKRDEMMALGDNLNDFSMIKVVGIFCAMANAHSLILEKSHIQTDTNDNDGVGKAIEKIMMSAC